MITIENDEKRVDWNAIRAEYIGGGISQRKLARKYGIAEGTLLQRANVEKWQELRSKASIKSITETEQKIAEAAADNATIAAYLKKRMLLRLKMIEKAYPLDATEVRTKSGNSTAIFRIRDLTAAYKDIIGDAAKDADPADDPLLEVLKRWDNASAGQ